jgi:ubiquinone/menaquinone biosynthesis C-methylase UbiE
VSLLVPRRRPSAEALDDARLSSEEMARSLRDLALVNRWWGGFGALWRHLRARIEPAGSRRARLLDVGSGSGDVARRLRRRLTRADLAVSAVASDVQWRHLAAGRRIGGADPLPAVAADGFRLPFADRSFDWVVTTLLFHHFSPEENVRALRELARVCRDGWAVLDLRRHLLPLLFVSVAGRLVFEARISVEDGIASVRQAYTEAEARAVAVEAVPGARVRAVFPFRLLITGPPLQPSAAGSASAASGAP